MVQGRRGQRGAGKRGYHGHEEAFEDDGYFHYLDYGSGFMYIYVKTSKFIL